METFDCLSPQDTDKKTIRLEDMPSLARGRMPEDFPLNERFIYLFDPNWRQEEPELVTGTIADVTAYDRPFRLGLPLDAIFSVLGEESRLLKGERTVTLESFKDSELPDMPRQIMMHSSELRSKMPSPGHVTLETPSASVARIIGISMNDNSLIPESAMPLLQQDEDFRAVWLLDGPNDLEKRTALEQAIHNWKPSGPSLAGKQRRARTHTEIIPGSFSHKVGHVIPSDYSHDNS
jgi:hypothetical protein